VSGANGSAAVAQRPGAGIGTEVLAHLSAQIDSARRLLGSILEQGAAIRARKVESVLACMADIKAEMELRSRLEEARTILLTHAGTMLGVEAGGVTLDAIATLMEADEASEARARSAELRGLLGEIAREHGINRALMRQELAFLDHLTRLIGAEPETGYRPGGAAEAPGTPSGSERAGHRVLDLQA
jgi:hypothetical protein